MVDRRAVLGVTAACLLLGGCANSINAGYPQLPGSTATSAAPVLTPAEQQKAIDELNAAKAKSAQSAGQ